MVHQLAPTQIDWILGLLLAFMYYNDQSSSWRENLFSGDDVQKGFLRVADGAWKCRSELMVLETCS